MPSQDRHILSPSLLNRMVRDLLADTFFSVWVEGEVSNLARPASGHMYFTLKDNKAQIRCAMFRSSIDNHARKVQAGDKVLVGAKVSVYEARGDYQLIVNHMEDAGLGALQRAFEELKAKLAGEGLFAQEHKKPLPALPERIGVITSATGAAIRDVLHVLGRRFPLVRVDVLPVPVQGEHAAKAITAMLNKANQAALHDVLLITRGGGSLEDLAAFNDEALARTIFAAHIPIISAVGHEIDFSISDFVADVRAPTPSAGAEMLVPDQVDIAARLSAWQDRMVRIQQYQQQNLAQHLDHAYQRLQRASPQQRLAQRRHELDILHKQLGQQIKQVFERRQRKLDHLYSRLQAQHPKHSFFTLKERLQSTHARLVSIQKHQLAERTQSLQELARTLRAVSPLKTLERGYAIVLDNDQHVLRSTKAVPTDEPFEIKFIDGQIKAKRYSG